MHVNNDINVEINNMDINNNNINNENNINGNNINENNINNNIDNKNSDEKKGDDCDYYLYTRPLLQTICNRNTHIIDQSARIRKEFNDINNKYKLYNIQSKSWKSKYLHLWDQIDTNIVNFWTEYTDPDPSPYKRVYYQSKYGARSKHQIHYLYGPIVDFYNKWCNHPNTVSLLQNINMKCPSNICKTRKKNGLCSMPNTL